MSVGRNRIWFAVARLLAAVVLIAVAPLGAGAQDVQEERHVINMRDADIHAFIEDVTAVTGYTFIPHPQVSGRVTVTSQTPLTRDEVFEVFLATLRNQGYAVIPAGAGTYRIVPEDDAAEATGVVGRGAELDDQFVTEVIPLRHIDSMEAARMVEPLVNHRGQVSASAGNNVLIVVDYAGNVQRVREVLSELDQDRSVVDTIALVNASAYDVARVVTDLMAQRGGEGSGPGFSAVALDSANSVLLRGDDVSVARARQLIGRLDVASEPTETLRVVRLRHAKAADLVPMLEAVARARAPAGAADAVQIPFDEATNAIVLTADPQTVAALARVIDDLDVRRAQVLVEAIIVEMSDDLARELGVQFLVSGTEDGSIPFATTNFSRSAPNLLAITGALTLDGDGDEGDAGSDALRDLAIGSLLGLEGAGFGVGGQSGDTLFGLILNAVQADADSNILSTPSIMTLNNEPAYILVGQNIPITTGEALSANNTNPFRQIEREDVGVQLEVTPQINEGDTIQLKLRQEVSSVIDVVGPTLGELVTSKREIGTTALADDGEIIVIGGLIESVESESVSKVPVLGDIPGLGRAFQSRGRSVTRTNLMVFIRSTIVRDADDARAAARSSYDTVTHGGAADYDAVLRDALGDLSVQSGRR